MDDATAKACPNPSVARLTTPTETNQGDMMNAYTNERLEALYENRTTRELEELLSKFQNTIKELSSYMNGGTHLHQMKVAQHNSYPIALELQRRKRASK